MLRRAVVVVAILLSSCRREVAAPTLTVFAAASLRDAFLAIEPAFLQAHPGVQVRFNFAGSHELRSQLEHGAPADVFASADLVQMERLADRIHPPRTFACNRLAIVVPRGNPGGVRQLADLAKTGKVVLAAAEVPAGAYTRELFARAVPELGAEFPRRVEAQVVSLELNVRQVLTRVQLGEANAGVVYASDARRAGDSVEVVAIPAAYNVRAEYPIAVLRNTLSPALAQAWVAAVLARPEVLTDAGFARCDGN